MPSQRHGTRAPDPTSDKTRASDADRRERHRISHGTDTPDPPTQRKADPDARVEPGTQRDGPHTRPAPHDTRDSRVMDSPRRRTRPGVVPILVAACLYELKRIHPAEHRGPNMYETTITNSRTMTVTETAAFLGISRTTAYECVRSGSIPSLRLGGRILVPTQAVESLLSEASHATVRVEQGSTPGPELDTLF